MIEGAAIGFEAVRQRIHACCRCDMRRQPDGEFRVGDHFHGKHLRMEDNLLLVVAFIHDDRGAADFRSRARCGGHRDDGRDAGGVRTAPPVFAVFIVPDGPCLAGHEGNGLARIHGAAATEDDDAVVVSVAENFEALFDVLTDGVRVHVGKETAGDARMFQRADGVHDHRQGLQARIGDDQWTADTDGAAGVCQLADAACAEADLGGEVPVACERGILVDHDVLIRWWWPLGRVRNS